MTFLVIIGTVTLYGLTAGPLARQLGLAEANPQGVVIIGAHRIGREISRVLIGLGFKAVLVDTNERNIWVSREAGLPVVYGNALSDEVIEDVNFAGIGRLLALTSNDEVNALAALHFSEVFDRSEMFQLPADRKDSNHEPSPQHLRGRSLFSPDLTFKFLSNYLEKGGKLEVVPISQEMNYETYKGRFQEAIYPLFLVTEGRQLIVITAENEVTPTAGQTLIALVPPTPEWHSWSASENDTAFLQPGQFMGGKG
jgi:Trk K+ transport system NAD-binding subunit